jgi:predicted  nucleic acid-binding Zn-ribbon protein
MSDERTQDIEEKYRTAPTIETVLERIGALGEEMRAGFAAVEKRLEDFDVRFDRMESDVSKTRSDMLTLRADFKELKGALKEHFPAIT